MGAGDFAIDITPSARKTSMVTFHTCNLFASSMQCLALALAPLIEGP